MAYDHGLLLTQRRNQRDHVADIVEDAVGGDSGWRA